MTAVIGGVGNNRYPGSTVVNGIIKKANQSYKYYLTRMGKEVAITAMKIIEFVIIPALNY